MHGTRDGSAMLGRTMRTPAVGLYGPADGRVLATHFGSHSFKLVYLERSAVLDYALGCAGWSCSVRAFPDVSSAKAGAFLKGTLLPTTFTIRVSLRLIERDRQHTILCSGTSKSQR